MPDADKKQIEEYGNVALTGEPMSYEYHSKTFDRYIRIKSFRPQSGRFATIFEDVSEWRKAEDEVKRRSDELQATLVTITAGVSRIRDRKVVWANPSHDTIFGYSHGELLGKETSTLYPDHESFERFGKEAYPQMITGSPVTIERLMKRKGGELFWCSLTGRLLDKGKPEEGSIWMVRDISDRKRSEAELQSALKEKQNLLYEIQHRAKNSFSMISSLIHLTALGEVPKQAVPILHELDTKVRSIAELYTMLYSSGSFAEVRMDEYILQVVSSLLSGLASRIALSTDFDRLTLHPREAAPIGLITTELITNAIKYAFPEGGEGKISLSLHTRDSENILEVEDDGVGLPNGFDISNGSGTGLQLVLALAGQLGGEFSISNATIGTKSRLVWKEKEH